MHLTTMNGSFAAKPRIDGDSMGYRLDIFLVWVIRLGICIINNKK